MNWLAVTGMLGFAGVGLGAFGAHGFKERLSALGTTEIWHTAVLYHLVHTVALFCIAVTLKRQDEAPFGLRWAPWAFLAGILIFSGSLYVLALSGMKWLGAITPIGGLGFLIGWAALVQAAFAKA